jgi:hypothetical protein
LLTTWRQARTASPNLWPAAFEIFDAATNSTDAAAAQHTFARKTVQAKFHALLACLDGSLLAGQTALARFRGVVCPGEPAWLESLPSAPCLTLSDANFPTALRRWLRLAVLPRGAPTVTCFCGTTLSVADLEHAHTCPTPNGLPVMRHDNIVEVVH